MFEERGDWMFDSGFLFVCFVLFIIWGVVVQSVGRG